MKSKASKAKRFLVTGANGHNVIHDDLRTAVLSKKRRSASGEGDVRLYGLHEVKLYTPEMIEALLELEEG